MACLSAAFKERLHCRSERWLASKQLVEDRTQAVDIRRGRQAFALTRRLFGRHIGGCAEDGGTHRQAGIILRQLGQPEIRDMRFALIVEQDIGRLQIAMENAALVGVMNSAGNLGHQARDFGLSVSYFGFGDRRLALTPTRPPEEGGVSDGRLQSAFRKS